MTVDAALRQGAALLAEAGVGVPRLTAEVLLAHTLRRDRSWLFAHGTDALDDNAWLHFGRHLHARSQGTPTQHLTGVQEFYGRDFHVTPDVLIPRPETEHLIEHALPLLDAASTVADIGTGSGIIGITLALESSARVLLTDVSEKALAVARGNALRLAAPVNGFVQGDLATMLAPRSLDLLISNPPYIPEGDALAREVIDHEPHLALFGGPDGHAVYRRLLTDAHRVVKPGGWLVLELGWQSAAAVTELAEPNWEQITIHPDLAGHPRALTARREGR